MDQKFIVPGVIGAVILLGLVGFLLPGETVGITGNFGLPGVREYGGSVHSAGYGSQARAFPGRAIEPPPPAFDCYQCTCPDGQVEEYNADNIVAVSKACSGFCPDGVATFAHKGGC